MARIEKDPFDGERNQDGGLIERPVSRLRFLADRNLRQFFPEISETDFSLIDRVLFTTVTNLLRDNESLEKDGQSLPLALTGSLAARILSENPRIEVVRQQLANLRRILPSGAPQSLVTLTEELARGPYDLDIKAGTDPDSQERFRNRFFNAAGQVLGIKADDYFASQGDDYPKEGKRQRVSGQVEGLGMEYSFGPIPSNPRKENGQVRFVKNGQEIFIVHFGFFPDDYEGYLADKRAGGALVSNKLQMALPLGRNGENIVLTESDEVLAKKRKLLFLPDSFSIESTGESTQDMEIALRAIRYGIFYHQGNQVDDLFTAPALERLSQVFKKARETFSSLGPSEILQRCYQKEILVCLEADPYLFLQVAERTGLFFLFPYFCQTPASFVRGILTANALTLEMVEDPENPLTKTLLPLYRRNQAAVLRQAELYLKSQFSGGKLFVDALDKRLRQEQNLSLADLEKLTREVFSFQTASRYLTEEQASRAVSKLADLYYQIGPGIFKPRSKLELTRLKYTAQAGILTLIKQGRRFSDYLFVISPPGLLEALKEEGVTDWERQEVKDLIRERFKDAVEKKTDSRTDENNAKGYLKKYREKHEELIETFLTQRLFSSRYLTYKTLRTILYCPELFEAYGICQGLITWQRKQRGKKTNIN